MSARQTIFMVLTAIAAAASMLYLQRRFDAADVKNGIAIARTYRAPSGWTLPDVIEARYPKSSVQWSGEEESACMQHVRVDAEVAPLSGEAPLDYAFVVDLNGPSIHPGNPLGEQAIGELDAPRPPDDAGPR